MKVSCVCVCMCVCVCVFVCVFVHGLVLWSKYLSTNLLVLHVVIIYVFLIFFSFHHFNHVVEFWLGTLRSREVVWMPSTGRFVSVLKIAFGTAHRNVRMEPYLYTVPDDMLRYSPLLRALGVRERYVRACL